MELKLSFIMRCSLEWLDSVEKRSLFSSTAHQQNGTSYYPNFIHKDNILTNLTRQYINITWYAIVIVILSADIMFQNITLSICSSKCPNKISLSVNLFFDDELFCGFHHSFSFVHSVHEVRYISEKNMIF